MALPGYAAGSLACTILPPPLAPIEIPRFSEPALPESAPKRHCDGSRRPNKAVRASVWRDVRGPRSQEAVRATGEFGFKDLIPLLRRIQQRLPLQDGLPHHQWDELPTTEQLRKEIQRALRKIEGSGNPQGSRK